MNLPLISIIVPIYNAEDFLDECISSLIKQTLNSIEIILVNDGSKDNSLSICEDYAKKDNRVIILSQENKGVSEARKNGVRISKGSYIMFVDSDDWIDLKTCEVTYNKITSENADAIIFSYIREYKEKSFTENIFSEDKTYVGKDGISNLVKRVIGLSGEELKEPLKFDSLSAMYMKLYKKEFITDDVEFVDLKEYGHHEDTIFNIQVFIKMNKVIYLNQPFYHYRKYSKNSISKTFELDYFKKWQRHIDYIESFIKRNKKENTFREVFQNRIALETIGLVLKETSRNNPRKFMQRKNYIKKIITNSRYRKAFNQLDLKRMPKHWKLFFSLCKNGNTFGVTILAFVMNYMKSRV